MITAAMAAKAYAAALNQGNEEVGPPAAQGGLNFGEVLKGVMTDTVQASRTAETKVVAGMQGKADLLDVVSALSSAQASLQTALAVRDQVISAYQQILAMQI